LAVRNNGKEPTFNEKPAMLQLIMPFDGLA
jgi:hypothetical protein